MVRFSPLVALLLAPSAYAGGFYYPDSGIVAFGRGGAWFASADDQFAQRYNPAALVRIDRPTVNVGLSAVQQEVHFSRLLEDDTLAPEVSNEAAPFLIPQMGFAMPLPENLAFAIGFTSPFAPDYRFDEDGDQRYTMIESGILNFQVGPSLAWRPVPWLAVGLSAQWQVLQVSRKLKVTTSGSDNPVGDVSVEIGAKDIFTFSGNFGLLVEPVEKLSIGVMFQPPQSYKGRGAGTLDFTGHALEQFLDQVVWTDDDVGLSISLPLQLGVGIATRHVPNLEIEVAGTWERWSSLKEIVAEDIDITVTNSITDPTEVDSTIALPAEFRDVFSARLGAEYFIDDGNYSVRAGGFWERGSARTARQSVALYDPDKVQISAGASALFFDHLGADVSFGYLFMPDLQIRDSEVTQINVFDEDEVLVVGNGDYRSAGWMVGGQLTYAFGPKEAK